MENAVEALKTAAAVLIFVIAITASFTMFSRAKATADVIIKSQDEQEYLESADLDKGVLYTSSEAIKEKNFPNMTEFGDRIVNPDDVISTIYRYSLEKYGVTIINSSGEVLVRFDSNTENIMRQWNNISEGTDENGNKIDAKGVREQIKNKIENNIKVQNYINTINLDLPKIYEINIDGNESIKCGAPWYGNDTEIINRINCDIKGETYVLDRTNI